MLSLFALGMLTVSLYYSGSEVCSVTSLLSFSFPIVKKERKWSGKGKRVNAVAVASSSVFTWKWGFVHFSNKPRVSLSPFLLLQLQYKQEPSIWWEYIYGLWCNATLFLRVKHLSINKSTILTVFNNTPCSDHQSRVWGLYSSHLFWDTILSMNFVL